MPIKWTPKLDKDVTKKRKLQANITDEYRCKNPQHSESPGKPQQKSSKQNLTHLKDHIPWSRTSLVAQTVKHLPTMWEIWVWSLGWEDPLDKEMATHSSTLAWKMPWMEEPGRLQSMGSQRVRHDWVTSLHFTWRPIKFKQGTPYNLKGITNCKI